jgi:NADH-quinone oxidoreductase subunit L
MMLIGNLALTGVGIPLLGIGTAGFYSKDGIINATFLSGTGIGTYAFVLTSVSVLMTSFYSWRQFLMTFHGPYRGEAKVHLTHAHAHDEPGDHHHGEPIKLTDVHESPAVILAPLLLLSVGALFAGLLFDAHFIGEASTGFWHNAIAVIYGHVEGEAELPLWVEFLPLTFTAIGFAIAYYYYVLHPELPPLMAAEKGLLYTFFYNKWYFDELYDFLFVRPAKRIGRFLWKVGDGLIIDGLGPDGITARVLDVTRGAVRLQSGYVYHYAFAMLVGVAALVTWFLFSTGNA